MDIRLGMTIPPTDATPSSPLLRWGILGCSKVAHDFTQALKFLSSNNLPHTISAVGSRCIERATTFARLHNIPHAHGSYEELCADSSVDIIYVASLHPYHKTHAEMALRSGKHVLVEKPMTMKASDAKYLYDLSKELNLFVGEGMWTRFFPAVEWSRCHFGEQRHHQDECDGIVPIGQVRVVNADFSIDGTDVGPYPTDSLYAADLGGGTAWCVLPYIVAAAMLPFDNKKPYRIAANGIMPKDHNGTMVGDVAMGMTLTFNNTVQKNTGMEAVSSPPGDQSIASGICSYLAESSEITMYAAKNGRITVEAPAHCPTAATIVRKSIGERGNGTTSKSSSSVTDNSNESSNDNRTYTVQFPLPDSTIEIEESGGIVMPNSMGFIYEAEAVRRLIGAKQISFPQWTPEESIECIGIVEEMLRQVNE